jgi:hypothetical protein
MRKERVKDGWTAGRRRRYGLRAHMRRGPELAWEQLELGTQCKFKAGQCNEE